ncbi:hypothetical protein PN497_08750 [Sphaerospermopsis kisseleviana CS-549]|uniref:Uncharacterized protein n=2 Tax=Sphaerospermopsis TaxID=752201 RepID=A0A479ZYB1_9CYAN|nr:MULTISPECIES: hypothetical protein [Sphaerospermopsis]MBD2131028.1 hypothetical protein [Sphaerospermopsis sp. FACHB-1094]MDB9441445.1 hypothetical protein [Sphaerospermopsis kisseleviana CS-549]BAZ83784.1 hypothetical protein NIES73_50730 [Sphaerospermopsis kisseleviana NIES-73]GCL37487.1 hypothetical protein SR1949_25980 [Sphaerospermopsis reniformis]
MSRLQRWLNMYLEKVNPDGTLKSKYIEQLHSYGFDNDYITEHGQGFKSEYEQLKQLDETDPESGINYTAYDFFTEEEKQQFNVDGSLKPEYVKYAHSIGISAESLAEMESRKKIEVDNYNELSARYAEQGINFGEQQMQAIISNNKTYLQRRKQMEIDLRNFEDVDTLPFEPETRY